MSGKNLFLILFLVSTAPINGMQHFAKKFAPKNSKVAFGWGVNAFISSVPLFDNWARSLAYKKRKDESQNGRFLRPLPEETKFIKRLARGPILEALLKEQGIDPKIVFETKKLKNLENPMDIRGIHSTQEDKIILPKKDILILKQSLSTDDSVIQQEKNVILFKLLQAQTYINNKSIEKQHKNAPLLYTTGMLIGQLVINVALTPLSLLNKISYIAKANSYAKNTYIFNGIKGYLKGSYAHVGGYKAQIMYRDHLDNESYDITCDDPIKKDILLQAVKDDYAVKLGHITTEKNNLDENNKQTFLKIKKQIIPIRIKQIETIQYYQDKNRKDHSEFFESKD